MARDYEDPDDPEATFVKDPTGALAPERQPMIETPEEKIRADAQRNVISPHIRENWDRYKRIWDEESQKAGENEKLYQMSPRQLKERGIK
jgi:hypothetical protein